MLDGLQDARASDLKDIDDDFDVEPSLPGNKKGSFKTGFANNKDSLRQGVSTGFNFKDILNSGDPCSEDELEATNENPLNELGAESDLARLWNYGHKLEAKESLICNVEVLID